MTNGGPGTSTWTPAYFAINAYSTRSNIGFASAAAVIMLVITLLIFLPLVLLTAWQARRREAAAMTARRRPRGRPCGPPAAAARRIRGSSIAILVFLTMCAALRGDPALCGDRHLVQDDGPDHAGPDLRAAGAVDHRALAQGLDRGVHRAWPATASRPASSTSVKILFPSLFLSIALSLGHRLRAGALERALGRHASSSSSSSAPSCRSRSS